MYMYPCFRVPTTHQSKTLRAGHMQGYLKARSSKLPWWASRYCELEEDGMLPALLTANSHPVNSFNFNSDIGRPRCSNMQHRGA